MSTYTHAIQTKTHIHSLVIPLPPITQIFTLRTPPHTHTLNDIPHSHTTTHSHLHTYSHTHTHTPTPHPTLTQPHSPNSHTHTHTHAETPTIIMTSMHPTTITTNPLPASTTTTTTSHTPNTRQRGPKIKLAEQFAVFDRKHNHRTARHAEQRDRRGTPVVALRRCLFVLRKKEPSAVDKTLESRT